MNIKEGVYTIEKFSEDMKLSRQSAINLLSKLRKKGFVKVEGGGHQKRIYKISKTPKKNTNGFYDIVNKYSPEKLHPNFEHYVVGKYTVENAIIDGIKIGGIRTKEATMHLFRHVNNWTLLFNLAKKHKLENQVIELYEKSIKKVKCRKMPRRYLK